MRKTVLFILFVGLCVVVNAQDIHQKLDDAVKHLQQDTQMKHAILGFYVVNNRTNEVVYDINGGVGLAAASTQKIFTSIAAFDILGSDYRYKTEVGYNGKINAGTLTGNVFIRGYGDPSFGSWRFSTTKRAVLARQLASFITEAGIHTIHGGVVLDGTKFSYQPIPGGWIWEDIGNYYGAGTWGINWNENQYDLALKPGTKEGDTVKILATDPPLEVPITNFLTTGPAGSGDNGYVYLPPYGNTAFAEGTEALGEHEVTISGALPNPAVQFEHDLQIAFDNAHINFSKANHWYDLNDPAVKHRITYQPAKILGTYYSPALDSLTYWFLQKSINLYGEAYAKTIAYEKTGFGSTDTGVNVIRTFWQQNGIEKSSVKMIDGSGLSPQNRVTANAEVMALQYAKTRPWFNSFYTALPVYNGIKMKSGTIGGSKAFAGYQTSANGDEYTFSIIINNYDGSAASIVHKMYEVLNVLK
ncbi:MAG TPA: D-alanyl-D-alanine carboxypeptidase/D-alanyl-D-alanine-endopeptidase [Chitinophagaceae bacterium]|nr:D-alanyl-D-alanine carboxypeptidase/D-alanyl-D-alanine-endopeptidase [Chitinophagaceae bacterium]